jgi:MFS family permease
MVECRATEPIVPLSLFGHRVFAADALLTLVQGMALLALSIPLLLFLQGVLALSPTAAGAVSMVLSVCLPIGAALTTVTVARLQRYQATIIMGMAFMALGSFLLTRVTDRTGLAMIGFSLALFGLGTGTFFAVQIVVAQNTIPQAHLGVATGVIRYLGQLGFTLGAAVIGIVVNGALSKSLPTTTAARIALAEALQPGFLVVLGLSGVCLITAFFLKDMPMVRDRTPQSRTAQEDLVQCKRPMNCTAS